MNKVNQARVFKAFCDESRVQILELLKEGEKCACILLENMHISQSTLSHHMKILCESGIVVARKEGKWMHYSVDQNGIEEAIHYLTYFKNTVTNEVCSCKQ